MTPRNIVMWLTSVEDPKRAGFLTSGSVAYHRFFKKISERDNFRFAYNKDSYKGGGVFSNVAKYINGKIVGSNEDFTADVIYQFSTLTEPGFNPSPAVITNTPDFRKFCISKIVSYEYMPQFYPTTFLVFNIENALSKVATINSDKVVLKPNKGEGGEGVTIVERGDFNCNLLNVKTLEKHGYIIQEFIDTSIGIPNIATTVHDLRITTHGEKISLCLIREPKRGSLVSNVHQGGTATEVDIDKIPDFIMDFYCKVHKEITKIHPRPLYNMDMGVGKNGPKLIELNSNTAFPDASFKCMDRFIDNLIEHLETI